MNHITRRHLLSTGLAGGISLAAVSCEAAPTASVHQQTTPVASSHPVKVQIVIFDQFEVTDALAPFDVLKVAGHLGVPFQTTLVTLNAATEVTALDGVPVKPTGSFDPSGDLLLVPGAPQLWRAGLLPDGLEKTLKQWKSAGKTITTVCTGAVLVARTGLLKGRNVTTHHSAFDVIKQEGVNLINARVVDDGDVITSAGVTSGIDLALYLVERYFGALQAIATEQVIEYERRGVVWRAK
jgi:transcriptional regulator GlxA family with amidase domain